MANSNIGCQNPEDMIEGNPYDQMPSENVIQDSKKYCFSLDDIVGYKTTYGIEWPRYEDKHPYLETYFQTPTLIYFGNKLINC